MELDDWKREKIEDSIQYLLTKRSERRTLLGITREVDDVIELEVTDDNNASIVLKVGNAIFNESIKGVNFIIVLYINQYGRDGLLDELFNTIQPRNYSKVFFVDELIASPVNNKLVPRYQVCKNEMVTEMESKYRITSDTLPKIRLKDPMARWNGWAVGDVIKMERPSGEIYYRIVIER